MSVPVWQDLLPATLTVVLLEAELPVDFLPLPFLRQLIDLAYPHLYS